MLDLKREMNLDHDESDGRSPLSTECLTCRLKRSKSFEASHAEWIRQQELEKPRPDYGTFLKDDELIELFPESADYYHVDDIRRALIMIRMILDYGEGAYTRDDGDAVYILLACILEQSDYALDGTWSANNPAARKRDARARPTSIPGLDFDDEDDDENE